MTPIDAGQQPRPPPARSAAEQLLHRLAHTCEVRVHAQRPVEGEERGLHFAQRAQDLAEARQSAEVARLEFEHAMHRGDALVVAPLQVVQRRLLVLGLGPVGPPAQQDREARLGEIEAPRGQLRDEAQRVGIAKAHRLRTSISLDSPQRFTFLTERTSQSCRSTWSARLKSERNPILRAAERTARSSSHQEREPLK